LKASIKLTHFSQEQGLQAI